VISFIVIPSLLQAGWGRFVPGFWFTWKTKYFRKRKIWRRKIAASRQFSAFAHDLRAGTTVLPDQHAQRR